MNTGALRCTVNQDMYLALEAVKKELDAIYRKHEIHIPTPVYHQMILSLKRANQDYKP